jgi:hypothetical protein
MMLHRQQSIRLHSFDFIFYLLDQTLTVLFTYPFVFEGECWNFLFRI